jgi:hypothetical protein
MPGYGRPPKLGDAIRTSATGTEPPNGMGWINVSSGFDTGRTCVPALKAPILADRFSSPNLQAGSSSLLSSVERRLRCPEEFELI